MKKNLLLTAALLAIVTFCNTKANAQVTTVTGNVNVNLVLSDAFSIVLGGSPDVTFTYATPTDYAGAKNQAIANEFTVISNKPYSVTVKANAAFNTISSTTPPLSAVKVAVNPVTASGGTLSTVGLTLAEQPIVAAATPTIGKPYTIDFSIPTAAPLLAMSAGTYTTTIVYTITQP